MKKIVMFEGEIETVGFFSLQMRKTFEQLGYEVYVLDFGNAYRGSMELVHFLEKDETVMVSFNFHGISEEPYLMDEQKRYIWDAFHVTCINILVDHPMYYHQFLCHLPERYIQISIDRNHETYMRRFYPQIRLGGFLPLAGTGYQGAVLSANSAGIDPETAQCTKLTDSYLPIADRPLGVTMTGNCADLEFLWAHVKADGPEYEHFYRGIVEELLSCPEKTLEEVAETHYRAQAEEPVTEEEIGVLIRRLTFVDLLVRYYTRGEVVRTLVDGGVRVHVYGAGFEQLKCRYPENLVIHGQVNSIDCLKVLGETKVSLNVMPWFKDGAHDRIFNSMLNGSVCLSDPSKYLTEILQNGKNVIFYQMNELHRLPELTKELLSNYGHLQEIADTAASYAAKNHTWADRAYKLHDLIQKIDQ